MPVIEVRDLKKTFRSHSRREGVVGSVIDLVHRRYQDLKAVDGISFSVNKGELLGYIGPNGAGKSTSIKMLTGILKPTSGYMRVLGFDPFLQRRDYTMQIGVVFGQRTQLWWDIAVIESFKLLRRIYHVPQSCYQERLERLTDILALSELFHMPVRKLSLGQRVRCDLAASLLHNPGVLFLDEPTIGLDTVAKDATRSFLRQINREFSTTIILTTHDLKEIEELCSRIIILDRGHIVYDGALEAIKTLPGLGKRLVVDFTGRAPERLGLSPAFDGHVRFSVESERRMVASFDPQVVPSVELIREILSKHAVADLTISQPSIEEVIIKVYREGVYPL